MRSAGLVRAGHPLPGCGDPDALADEALGVRVVTGHAELRARYGSMFEKYPALHCEIVSRIRVGEFVLHEESITGRDETPEHVVAIYRVRSGLIDHVRFLR